MKGPRVSYNTQTRVCFVMKTGWIYFNDEKRNPNAWRREMLFPVEMERVGVTEVLVIELIDYTIQDSTQAKNCMTGSLTTSSRWLNTCGPTVRFGLFLTAPQDMCLSGVDWLSWVEKEDDDNSSLSGSSSTLFSCLFLVFQMQKPSQRRHPSWVLWRWGRLRITFS